MNRWLTKTVETYTEKYGKATHPVIYEIGSRDGRDAVELGVRVGTESAQLVAVEAHPGCADKIAAQFPHIKLHRCAVSDFVGEAPFIIFDGTEGDIGSSSLRLDWKKGELRGHVITVPVDKLENIISHDEIDVMKIDVEGKSLEVLHGMGDKIGLVKVYHIETEKKEPERQEELKKLMTDNGYELIAVENEYNHLDDMIWRKEKDVKLERDDRNATRRKSDSAAKQPAKAVL